MKLQGPIRKIQFGALGLVKYFKMNNVHLLGELIVKN